MTSHRHANSIQISLGQHNLIKAHFMQEKTEIHKTIENILTALITSKIISLGPKLVSILII